MKKLSVRQQQCMLVAGKNNLTDRGKSRFGQVTFWALRLGGLIAWDPGLSFPAFVGSVRFTERGQDVFCDLNNGGNGSSALR